jgi:hypothetical protein
VQWSDATLLFLSLSFPFLRLSVVLEAKHIFCSQEKKKTSSGCKKFCNFATVKIGVGVVTSD